MTKENLLKYLKNPAYLQQISYQELKTLVAEHPNSLSLRYLLALKSKQENNSDLERQLAYLSTYGFDRAHFFDVFNKTEQLEDIEDILIPEEDVLELKELSALERELSAAPVRRTTDLLFERTAPSAISSFNTDPETVSNEKSKEEFITEEQEDYYVLNFDEELDASAELSVEEATESQIEGNLAAIEDLFKDLEDDLPEEEGLVETELKLQETVAGGDFPDIPLEVLDTNVDVVGTESDLSLSANNSIDSIKEPIPSVNTDNTEIEIVPEMTEETLEVNPIPKSSFSTWYKHKDDLPTFAGFDLVGFNSKGIVDELSEADKERYKIEQLREERLRLARLQENRTATNVSPIEEIPTEHSIAQEEPLIQEPTAAPTDKAPFEKEQKADLKEIKQEVENSIVFKEDIASETLAQLLILQGHYSKARAMYNHLSLIFPEKSGLFAYEIQKIENLEDEVA